MARCATSVSRPGITAHAKQTKPMITFKECQQPGYAARTAVNAGADVTIAFAVDFRSAGEVLTKRMVAQKGKAYLAVDAHVMTITENRVIRIINALNEVDLRSLNIAGNSLHTIMKFRPELTQIDIDEFCFDLLFAVFKHPALKRRPDLIRSGGQTGFDESGIKASSRFEIPALCLAPKGWMFRDENGVDISDEKRFKERFVVFD